MLDFLMYLIALAAFTGMFAAGYRLGVAVAKAEGYEAGVSDTVDVLVGNLRQVSDLERFDSEQVYMDLRNAIDKGVDADA